MKPQANTVVPAEKNEQEQKNYVLLHPEDATIGTDGQPFYDEYDPELHIKRTVQQDSDLKMSPPDDDISTDEEEATSLCNKKKILANINLKTYALENFDGNVMIIFNHNEVDGYNRRTGTEYDVERLKDTFEKLNFQIIVHTDLTRDDLKAVLEQFSATDFTDFGCVVVAVLTHGVEDGYLSAKDYVYHESELIDPLIRNPTLVSKPKIFLIQACRGPRLSEGIKVGKYNNVKDYIESEDEDLKKPLLHTLPRQADVLLLHSTYAGFVSYRETTQGSWFIQALCRNIDKLGDTEHFEDILRAVKYDVAIHRGLEVYSRKTGETELHKQMPVVMSTLRKKLYFTKSHPDDKSY